MKILLTGATGFVGRRLFCDLENVVVAPSLRNAGEDEVKRIVGESGCDVIINTAAISDIPTCEKDPEGSYKANVLLPVYLARAAAGRKLICFSSDQVYTACQGLGPYREEDAKPKNIYSVHKLEMEKRVLDISPDAVMLRAEWMYDYISYKRNYFLNLLAAKDSVSFSKENFRGITYLGEVSASIPAVINLPGGVYNYGSETEKSMYDITAEFLEILGKDIALKDCPAGHNLWMDCSKARKYGVDFSDPVTALKKCLTDMKNYEKGN